MTAMRFRETTTCLPCRRTSPAARPGEYSWITVPTSVRTELI
jgi:hypothetical protein